MYSPDILSKVREHRILHEVTLELTYRCNLDCFFCYNDREQLGKPLSLAQYRVLLEDLAEMQTLFVMLTGGEPMVHPEFYAIGQACKELGFATRVRTNGHTLTRKAVSRLLTEVDPYMVEISLHGATAEVHDRQTRIAGSFERLLNNIRIARDAGLRLSAVSTPTSWNEHQIEAMFELTDVLGIPLRFQGPVAPRDNGDTTPLAITPSVDAWTQIERLLLQRREAEGALGTFSEGSVSAQSKNTEPAATCSVGQAGVDIDPYGNVQACMHLKQSAGNLHERSIKDIWNHSPLFVDARQRAIASAERFEGGPLEQYGAPLFCLAVEENANKGCSSPCASPCASACGP